MLYVVVTRKEDRDAMLGVNAILAREDDDKLIWKLFDHHSVVDHISTLSMSICVDQSRIDEVLESI